MAISVNVYGHTLYLLLTKAVDFTAIKLELLNNSAVFSNGDTTKAQVDNSGAYEVSGNGWPVGGPLMTNVTFTTTAIDDALANDCIIDADDVIENATGGTIGPAYNAVAIDSSTGKPLFFVSFGQMQVAGDTTPFKVVWPTNGIFNFIV